MSGGLSARYGIQDGDIELNPGRRTITLTVRNSGDRAIQVGSHYHFFEANAGLDFDRKAAWGMHLAIPSGLAVRFEPGDEQEVTLVDFGGLRVINGFAGLCEGPLDDDQVRERAFKALDTFLRDANRYPRESNAGRALTDPSFRQYITAHTKVEHPNAQVRESDREDAHRL